MKYAHVAILKKPGAFDAPLTYSIPESLSEALKVGTGVEVLLKDSKCRGIVVKCVDESGLEAEVKPIESILEELTIDPLHVELAKKMAIYYQCSLLRALKLMLPNHLWKGTGKRILKKFKEEKEAVPSSDSFPRQPLDHQLTSQQQEALKKMQQAKKPILLHGVTGSGKTELYLRLILETVQSGRQAILLLPEIGLTSQMEAYFSRYFGESLAIFHSKLSNGERLKNWLKVKTGQARFMLGSRSAIFAPAAEVGLIILDEEHEWTYKQESSPYYQTHHVAHMLRDLTNCKVLFGTATPRLETYHKAKQGIYEYVQLPERINQKAMPTIQVVDLRDEFKKKNYSIFSTALYQKIKDRLEKKEQMILFVNQRGMARAVVCRDCGHTLQCPDCEVSLKLHDLGQATLICHYCGFQCAPSLSCPTCQSVNIRHVGVGTQRVEKELHKAFPGIRVIRADKDSTSDKQGFSPIYHAFKNGEYDVMVGTQMVAKGHDFANVTLIGIILADIGLHIPDFRSHERLFHLLTQVSGRAGRAEVTGEVVLQTYQPDHHAIQLASEYNYEQFAGQELKFREKLGYPPFGQMVKFTVLGQDLEKLKIHLQVEKEVMEDISKSQKIPLKILYAPAMIPRMGLYFYYHVLVRSDDLSELFEHWKVPKKWRVDIDPVHTA